MEEYKSATKKTYNLHYEEFEEKFTRSFQNTIKEADKFLANLNGKKIIDLGCGSGNHAQYFQKKGFDVLCIDYSEKMLELCKKRDLKTKLIDIEDLQLPESSTNGIWAYACLLHIQKEKIPKIAEKFTEILKAKGLVGLALKEGEDEGFVEYSKHPFTQRWVSYFQDEEVRELFGKDFELINFSRTKGEDCWFLNYLLRLKD